MTSENLHARGFTVGWPHEPHIELDADIGLTLDDLRHAFPDICIWYGAFTESLWALLPDRLVEAKNATGLARQLHAAHARPIEGAGFGTSAPWASARQHDGTWAAPPIPAPTRPAAHPPRPGLLTRLMAACRRRFTGSGRVAQRRPGPLPHGPGRSGTVRPTSIGVG